MKIVYTESALAEIEKFQTQHKKDIEELLKKNKYVFGDDFIEITAFDIKEAEKSFIFVKNRKSGLPMTILLLKVYFIAGIVLTAIGIFYPYLIDLLRNNPKQIFFVIGGLLLSGMSLVGNYYIRFRYNRQEEFERRLRYYENISSNEKETANK